MDQFFARDRLAFAGDGGGGVGEEGVAGGVPAGAGVGEVADDEDGCSSVSAWSRS